MSMPSELALDFCDEVGFVMKKQKETRKGKPAPMDITKKELHRILKKASKPIMWLKPSSIDRGRWYNQNPNRLERRRDLVFSRDPRLYWRGDNNRQPYPPGSPRFKTEERT